MTKMIKHLGAFFLVFVMIFATVITACAAEYENKFTDVSENAWYAEAVQYCDENGLMSGVSEDSFLPNGTIWEKAAERDQTFLRRRSTHRGNCGGASGR